MKILFTNPPWWPETATDAVDVPSGHILAGVRAGSRWPHTLYGRSTPDNPIFGDYLPYPFFLGYAATYMAKKTGANVVLRDSIARKESYESYFRYLSENAFDFIFMESSSPSWQHDSILIHRIHTTQPRAKIVVTGPITNATDDILENLPVVACIKGEYEKGAIKVVEGATGMIDFDLLTVEEMNAAPFPYYDEDIAHRYWDGNPKGQIPPQAQVWSSRGCPFKCIFCVWPAAMTGNDPLGDSKRTVRHYTAEYMEAFLSELIERYQMKCVYFDDDTFNLGNKHVVDMCRVMKKLNVPWSAMCRADTSRFESWVLMKESGCLGVKIGVESGNQWVVDNIVNKHLDLDIVRRTVNECHRIGLTVHGTFTYGLPGESHEQRMDTKRFINSLPFDTYQESGTAVIEGTPLDNLETVEVQKNFPGAKMDGGFSITGDGGQKWRDLAQSLRDN